MRLGQVIPGDVVKVDKRGLVFLVEVESVGKDEVTFTPPGRVTYYAADADEIVGHWKRPRLRKNKARG